MRSRRQSASQRSLAPPTEGDRHVGHSSRVVVTYTLVRVKITWAAASGGTPQNGCSWATSIGSGRSRGLRARKHLQLFFLVTAVAYSLSPLSQIGEHNLRDQLGARFLRCVRRRLCNSLMMHGRNNGKKLMAVGKGLVRASGVGEEGGVGPKHRVPAMCTLPCLSPAEAANTPATERLGGQQLQPLTVAAAYAASMRRSSTRSSRSSNADRPGPKPSGGSSSCSLSSWRSWQLLLWGVLGIGGPSCMVDAVRRPGPLRQAHSRARLRFGRRRAPGRRLRAVARTS